MAEQAHARFYRSLPPDRSRRWRRLRVSAGVLIAASAIAVPVLVLAYATNSPPPSPAGGFFGAGWFAFGPVLLNHYVLMFNAGSFIVGALLGFTLAWGWRSTLALYVVGFAISLALVFGAHTPVDMFGGFFWMFGVSAGVGLRGLIHRHRVLRASFVSQPI